MEELQLADLRRYGTEEHVTPGDVLYAAGDQPHDLIVVLDGEIQIIDRYREPGEFVVITIGPREFLGEIGLLTGQRSYVTAAVSAPGRILRISLQQLLLIMDQELELSELFLRAFLVRHSGLTSRGSGLTVVGSRFDVGTR